MYINISILTQRSKLFQVNPAFWRVFCCYEERNKLKKAIEKAVENGFDKDNKSYWKGITSTKNVLKIMMSNEGYYSVIFSHDFAKAFWGKGWVCTNCGEPTELEEGEAGICEHNRSILGEEEAFEYHLQQMVLEKDPIKYLEKFI